MKIIFLSVMISNISPVSLKKNVKDENGNKKVVEEQAVVYWSRKFQLRAERENKKFLDFLQKLQEHPENFRITAVQSKALRRFSRRNASMKNRRTTGFF